MPELEYDAILTDPPYGINKAEWDSEFTEWMWQMFEAAKVVGVMPGVWNLTRCPQVIGNLKYQWTLAARLTNGMTRGAIGFGNWIPCLIYGISKSEKAPVWCSLFADWCQEKGVTKKQLDAAAGTSDMGGWWASRLPHRAAIPTPELWEKIKPVISAPDSFDAEVYAQIYDVDGDCKEFAIGREDKPDHPSPKPLGPTQWFLSRLPGRVTVDPFMGSGTTGVAAIRAGRRFIGIEKDPAHYAAAVSRIKRELSQGDLFHSQHNTKLADSQSSA